MLKTAESVRAGHPDKLCDYIADYILDSALYGDPAARVAVEILATKARVVVAGEITCKTKLNIPRIVRDALEAKGYDPRRFRIRVHVHRQSGDIAGGVNTSLEARHGQQDAYAAIGAGDQGTVYGYATAETQERLPLPLVYAHRRLSGQKLFISGLVGLVPWAGVVQVGPFDSISPLGVIIAVVVACCLFVGAGDVLVGGHDL